MSLWVRSRAYTAWLIRELLRVIVLGVDEAMFATKKIS